MDPNKKTSLFSQAMKEKKMKIEQSKGFPQAIGFTIPTEEKKENPITERLQETINDIFDDITQEDFRAIEEENIKTISSMDPNEVTRLQELFRKELGENVIERIKSGVKKFDKTVVEDKVLKSKLIDDFNSTALKNTIFSQQADEQRDFDTFIDRVYYDNYGNYAIYDEKTHLDLKDHESDFNSFSQLVNGLPGVQGTPAFYTKILQKLIMIAELWQKNLRDDFVCLKFEDRMLRVNLKIIMKKILIDYRLIEGIIFANHSHGYIYLALGLSSFELIDLLLDLTYSTELEIIKLWRREKNFFTVFDRLINEDSFFEYLKSEGYLNLIPKIFEKMDLNQEIRSYFLKLIKMTICLTKRESFTALVSGGIASIIAKIFDEAKSTMDSELIEHIISVLEIMMLKNKTEFEKNETLKSIVSEITSLSTRYSERIKELVSEKTFSLNLDQPSKEIIEKKLDEIKQSEEKKSDMSEILELIKQIKSTENIYQSSLNEVILAETSILKTNIFKSSKDLTSNSINDYIEYFSSESGVLCRDLLSKNLLLINCNPDLIKKLVDLIIIIKTKSSQIEVGASEKSLLKWIENNLDHVIGNMMARLDLWFMSKDKMKARNNQKFSSIKKIALEFSRNMIEKFHSLLLFYLSMESKEDLPRIIKLLYLVEYYHRDLISSDAYKQIFKLLDIKEDLNHYAVFVFPNLKNTESKAIISKNHYENTIKILSNIFKNVAKKHPNSIPVHRIFIKILLKIFSDDSALYLDKTLALDLKAICYTLIPHLNFDLLGIYAKNNLNAIDKSIDQYAYNSYGDHLFSSIIFLFGSRHFQDDIRKAVWTNVASYPQAFYEAMQDMVFFDIEDTLLCKKRPHSELQSILFDIKDREEELPEEFCSPKFLLHKVLSSYLAFK